MSRSLRSHPRQPRRPPNELVMVGPFPTPPSSASTPPIPAGISTTAPDDGRPRKRARSNPPSSQNDTTPIEAQTVVSHESLLDNAPLRPETKEIIEVKPLPTIRRIKIKMSGSPEPSRAPSRLSRRNDQSDDETVSTDAEDDETTTIPTQASQEVKESWDDYEIREMVDSSENWRVIGLSNVGNTCFSNAVLQVFGQTEILREFFINRYPYIRPPLKAINVSADLTSRSSRSKTRQNQTEEEPPELSSKTLCAAFSRLLRAVHPEITPASQRLGITYHQPKKHKSDSKYTIAPRDFIGAFNSVYPYFRKGQSQEDAMEFFAKVRERLHEELRAELEAKLGESEADETYEDGSPISDIFRGYCITKRTCTICKSPREAQLEETWQLQVSVPPMTSTTPFALPDLIAHYGGVEKDVNVACRTCGKNTPHDSRPSYLQTPRILVIQALRFVVPPNPPQPMAGTSMPTTNTPTPDTESNTGTEESPTTDSETSIPPPKRPRRLQPLAPLKRKVLKNPAHVTFPLTNLDMKAHLHQQNSTSTDELYDLFGVVEHIGRRMDGGHYIAYVRARNGEGEDAWWKCNDAKCWMVGNDVVKGAQGYIWFYERRSQRGWVPEMWPELVEAGETGLATPESEERVQENNKGKEVAR